MLRGEPAANEVRIADHGYAKRVPHLRMSGKGGKTQYLPLHPGTYALVRDGLAAAGHGDEGNGTLFRPVRNNRTGDPAPLPNAPASPGAYVASRRSRAGRPWRTAVPEIGSTQTEVPCRV